MFGQTFNPFQGLATAKPSVGGDYLGPGQHLIEVKLCKYQQSQDPKKLGQPQFIAELTVLKSTDAAGKEGYPAGTKRSWFVAMTTEKAKAEIKAFVIAALGHDPKQIEAHVALGAAQAAEIDALLMSSVDPQRQACAGRRLLAVVEAKQMKPNAKYPNPGVFNKATFYPVDQNTGSVITFPA